MPKRGKEPRPSSRHSSGRFSPSSQPLRQSRNDYQIAGSSRSTCDSTSGRRSPHTKDNIKKSNGNVHPGNSSNRMSIVNSPIILTDDDDDDDNVYKNLDTNVNLFRENGNKLKPDPGEGASLVKHFVPSADRYHMSQSVEKPTFRGPETDVLHDLGNDKLKTIRVQMIRADIQQNESFRKTYLVEDPVAGNRSKDKNHQNFEERQVHFNQNNQQMLYDNDKNYGMTHPMSPTRLMSRDQSLSPRITMARPPSPPLPYSPELDHFNSDNMLRRDRSKRSPERNAHDRPPRPEHFLEQMKMDNFSSGPPPEPRSPEIQRFRPGDHNRHRSKDDPIHYEDRPRHSRSPVYFENHYQYNRNMSPDNRPFSPNHEQLPITPPSLRELSSPLRDRPPHPNDRPRRRRTPPPRRDRSRERRRRLSPRRRTPPPVRSPMKRRENSKRRGPNKNQEARKRDAKERKRRSQSKPKSSAQQEHQQQQSSFQQPQPQPMYPPPPPPGVVRMPPRPFPPGPMMIPLRPPPFPPPMGAWRPPRPPMQAPPSGWPYPRPRPFYFPY